MAVQFTPAAAACPGADNRLSPGSCQSVTYYQPAFQIPTVITLAMAEGFNRTCNGVEVTGR